MARVFRYGCHADRQAGRFMSSARFEIRTPHQFRDLQTAIYYSLSYLFDLVPLDMSDRARNTNSGHGSALVIEDRCGDTACSSLHLFIVDSETPCTHGPEMSHEPGQIHNGGFREFRQQRPFEDFFYFLRLEERENRLTQSGGM